MIIVSQDRDAIVNFDRIESIWINDNVLDGADIVAGDEVIGEYETEGRAKEVLKEMVQLFTEEDMFHINNLDGLEEPKYILRPVSRNKVFYMPEEKEGE